MKKTTTLVVAAVAVAAVCGGSWLLATEDIATETDLRCTACHDKPGSKLLTDKGIYYETQGTLDGFEKLSGSFGKCTTCHVRKPGSTKLTAEGKKMADLVDSMSDLKDWLDKNHPAEPKKGED